MVVPRVLRPIVGSSVASATVGVLALSSLVTYLIQAKTVSMMTANWSYLDFVLRSVANDAHFRAFAIGFSPSLFAALTFTMFVASCVAVGWLTAVAMRSHRSAVPMAWVGALGAAVIPTLAIATVRWPDGGGSITDATIVVVQLLFVGVVWRWSRGQSTAVHVSENNGSVAGRVSSTATPATNPEVLSPWLRLGIVLAVCYALTVLLSGFSGIFGYDSFSDHLAVPARWLLAGRLEHGLPEEIVSFYPGNFELLVRWTLSLGTDRLAFLLSFGSSIAAVWVVYRIAMELGQSRTAAVLSALGAASLQVLAYQSMVVYSDSYTALCLLLATWLLLIWARDGASDNRVVCGFGVALGLALGAKYSAGPPVIVLGLAWLFCAFRESFQVDDDGIDRPRWRRFFGQNVLLAVSVLPAMAYWYVRNALETGNPLFPLSVAGLPGINLGALIANAPGPKTTFERLTFPWTEFGHIAGYETGLGPLFATVVVVAVCALPFSRPRAESMSRFAWLILLGAYIAWWRTGVLVPRYGFFPLLLSFVFVGELWTAFSSRLLGVVYGATVCITMLSVGHEMLGGAAYNELMYDPKPLVPSVINELPTARILNASGQPSGYYARGADLRHTVINPFQPVLPEDVRRLSPDYLLIPQAREPEFASLELQLVGRWEKQGQPPTSLWRVVPSR